MLIKKKYNRQKIHKKKIINPTNKEINIKMPTIIKLEKIENIFK
jgi:hypothetical protein